MNDARLQELVDAHLEERLTPTEADELSAWLVRSPQARRFFWEHTAVHGLLQRAVQLEWLGAAQQGRSPRGARRWAAPKFFWAGIAAAAAAVAIVFWTARSGGSAAEMAAGSETEARSQGVATITRLAGVRWSDPTATAAAGSVLAPGWLRFETGLVQLEFFSGASVVVEGPAEFEIRSEREAFCRNGRFRATVPEPARGFTVGSPNVALVDLGTAFGMEVARGGDGEVFVYEGRVRLTRIGAQPIAREIAEGRGVRVDAAGAVSDLVRPAASYATAGELARRQHEEARVRLAEWRETDRALGADPSLLVRFNFEEAGPDDRTLLNRAPRSAASAAGTLVGCQWSEGRWPGKGALEFKGVGDRVRLMVPGELDAVTFSAWVRADSLAHRYNALLVSDLYRRGALRWQLTQLGQIALTQVLVDDQSLADPAHTQRVLSAPALPAERLGRWIHVATVADLRTGVVTHYADGAAVGAGKFAVQARALLGSVELGNWGIGPETERGRRLAGGGYLDRAFVGRIDEFSLHARALGADEVRRLFRAGRVEAEVRIAAR